MVRYQAAHYQTKESHSQILEEFKYDEWLNEISNIIVRRDTTLSEKNGYAHQIRQNKSI